MLTIKLDTDTQLVVRRGREAWTSLRTDATWEKWVVIGRAIEAGKTAVMRELGTNLPSGRRWNETFGTWLKETDFDQINKATRSHLQTCLDNLPAIEAWRQTIGLGLRLQLNHPYTVLRRWQASRPSAVAGTSQGNARAGLREENMRLKEELDAHKAKIRRLVADERWPQITRSDTPGGHRARASGLAASGEAPEGRLGLDESAQIDRRAELDEGDEAGAYRAAAWSP